MIYFRLMKYVFITSLLLFSSLSFSLFNKKLNILVTTSCFPPKSGTAVLNNILGLIDRKHNVYVWANSRRKLQAKDMHPEVRQYKLLERSFFGQIDSDLEQLLHTIDIIFCQFGNRGAQWLKIKKKLDLKAKIVTCFRGNDITAYVAEHPDAYNDLVKKGDLFLPVCDYFRNILLGLGADPDKVKVHYSSINTNKFTLSPSFWGRKKTLCVASVGRLVEKKGFDIAIRAIAKLSKRVPHINYIIIGDGKLRKRLQRLINLLKMQKKIFLYGWGKESDVINILSKSHLFILPSKTSKNKDSEGIPNAVKEAMSMGLPVIVTDHAGNKELVTDKKEGLVIQEDSVDALFEALAYLIKNKEYWNTMGKNGRKKIVQNFDVNVVHNKLDCMFQQLCEKD